MLHSPQIKGVSSYNKKGAFYSPFSEKKNPKLLNKKQKTPISSFNCYNFSFGDTIVRCFAITADNKWITKE